MKRGTCIKCASNRIRHFEHVLDVGGRSAWSTRYINQEFRVLGAVERSTGVFSKETHLARVEVYACAACGFFEECVKDPTKVPWDEMPSSRWL